MTKSLIERRQRYPRIHGLTERTFQVVEMLGRNPKLKSKEIAEQLGIKPFVVQRYIDDAMEILNIEPRKRENLVRWYRELLPMVEKTRLDEIERVKQRLWGKGDGTPGLYQMVAMSEAYLARLEAQAPDKLLPDDSDSVALG